MERFEGMSLEQTKKGWKKLREKDFSTLCKAYSNLERNFLGETFKQIDWSPKKKHIHALYMMLSSMVNNDFFGCETRDFWMPSFQWSSAKNKYNQHFTNLNDHTMKSLILDAQYGSYWKERENPIFILSDSWGIYYKL